MRTTAVLLEADEEEITPEKNLVTVGTAHVSGQGHTLHQGSPWKSLLCPVILTTSQKRIEHAVQYFKCSKILKINLLIADSDSEKWTAQILIHKTENTADKY